MVSFAKIALFKNRAFLWAISILRLLQIKRALEKASGQSISLTEGKKVQRYIAGFIS